MSEYQVKVNWRWSVSTETARATSHGNAKDAALARFPGGTLRRVVRVS